MWSCKTVATELKITCEIKSYGTTVFYWDKLKCV